VRVLKISGRVPGIVDLFDLLETVYGTCYFLRHITDHAKFAGFSGVTEAGKPFVFGPSSVEREASSFQK
jgi:hypothetical protein